MATAEPDITEIVLAMERAALERWGAGDPDGFLEISDAEVLYFDPFRSRGWTGSTGCAGGTSRSAARSTATGSNLGCRRRATLPCSASEGSLRWNTTEVYRNGASGWRIIHTHWAFYEPKIAA
jgi:hypothetical protein